MLSLRKRIKDLSDKTTSLEAKKACQDVLESIINVPDSQLSAAIVEKLKTVTDADKHVASFINLSEKLAQVTDLGISKAIGKIKESQIINYPALSYSIAKVENAMINQQAPEVVVIDPVLEMLKTFTWDPTVKEVHAELQARRANLRESIDVYRCIHNLSKVRGSFIYDKIVEKLEAHFQNPTDSSRASLNEDLTRFSFNADLKGLLDSFRKAAKAAKGSMQIISENANCEIKSAYSPILLENGEEFFSIKGNFFKKVGNSVQKMDEASVSALPEKFRTLCQILRSPNVLVKEGSVSFYINKDKVEILERENGPELIFNGKSITTKDFAKHMISAGMFRIHEGQVANQIQSVFESFGSIYNLDFAKIIESRVFPGVYAIVMKSDDKICLNKVNESQKSNEFFSNLNATQARNIILNFVGFDIKESLEEYLEVEEKKIAEMKESQTKILSNIGIVEEQLAKVKASLGDPHLAGNPQLKSLESMLKEEADKLKAQHRKISENLKSFESKASDAGFETGDPVRITDLKENGTIVSIDSTQGKVSVITDNGKTIETSIGNIENLEDTVAAAEAAHAKEADAKAEGTQGSEASPPALSQEDKNLKKAVQEADVMTPGTDVSTADPNKEVLGNGAESTIKVTETDPYVTATLAPDGKVVKVLASDFTSKGDDEEIEIIDGDQTTKVAKKLITLTGDKAPVTDTAPAPANVPTTAIDGAPSAEPVLIADPASEPVTVVTEPVAEPAAEPASHPEPEDKGIDLAKLAELGEEELEELMKEIKKLKKEKEKAEEKSEEKPAVKEQHDF